MHTLQAACRDRVEAALARIADKAGEGARAFLSIYSDAARADADAADARRRRGVSLGPLDGTIVSVKDLFDVAGEVTTAGSRVLAGAAAAVADAAAVQRLRQGGAVLIGRTNMTEFAFSGVGYNPHYGTPGNPHDRARIPGGSSSGAAVSVADRMAEIGMGSDTGGSLRIPAALCGVVGFKSTIGRVPTAGAFPLSTTLDTVGTLSASVADCARAFAVLSGSGIPAGTAAKLPRLAAIRTGRLLDETEPAVVAAFESAQRRIGRAVGDIATLDIEDLLDDMAAMHRLGTFPAVEAAATLEEVMKSRGADMDPLVRARVERGLQIRAADYARMLAQRRDLIARMDARLADCDAVMLPTVPIRAPTIAEASRSDGFARINMLLLRNTMVANIFDLPAISLPLPVDGLPVGLMLMGRRGQDERLLAVASRVEATLVGDEAAKN
jgi:aspartyl-tRNA(Asn)/glutamyl-tRNA(Gln) amidotransferase subunit A